MTRRVMLAIVVFLCADSPTAAQSDGAISYSLRYERGGQSLVSIGIEWGAPLPESRSFVMPRAIPMGYGEQRYDEFVADLQAFAAERSLAPPEREEGPRWRVPAGATRVSYHVDLAKLERDVLAASDQSRVRDGYLGALGYSVFGYIDGDEMRPVRLRIEGPAGWPVFSTLAPAWPVAAGPVTARADDFYALADNQIVMGPRAVFRKLADKPAALYLAAYAEGPVDLDRVGRLAVTALERVSAYFGTVPFPHYTVHQELLAPLSPRHQYGMSMEHLSSSTYYLAAATGLTAAATAADDTRVMYNFAHHIAHAWVPKRAYGHGYFPFSWEIAPVIDSIWFAEGFGQYAAAVALAAGMPDPRAYRESVLNNRFRSNIASAPPFLKRLPLVELSRIASTRYAEDFRTGRLVFSRGGLMAAAIDERIQQETRGQRSLRDALRALIDWCARERRGFAVTELAGLIKASTGVDVSAEIERWLAPM